MSIVRKEVGQPTHYKDHLITATLAGPDLLGYVDGIELANFYINTAAVVAAGKRYVDDKIKATTR